MIVSCCNFLYMIFVFYSRVKQTNKQANKEYLGTYVFLKKFRTPF